MGYGRNGYARRGYQRQQSTGRIAKVNARPGPCRSCGEEIPAGAGQLWRDASGAWSVVHVEESQGGWLMHPQPVRGGCPGPTDRRNAELHASGFLSVAPASERENIAATAAVYAARTPGETPRRSNAYGSSGTRRGRCEDAPCCGCCD